jgi:ferrochelatase
VSDAILLIGHGSVESETDIPAFVSNIRRGRPTPPEVVAEVTRRFRAIGGSPLLAITRRQAAALEGRLGIPVGVGMRLWQPWAKDAVAALAARGVTRVVSLPLAPFSVNVYHATSREACAAAKVACAEAPPWGQEPALVDAFADRVMEALGKVPSERRGATHLVLTAHSLPAHVLRGGDPYEGQIRATADAVVATLAARGTHLAAHVAYQSQGADGGEWLGPDLRATFDALAAAGARDVVVCAIGFLADHTEILYDLDVEAKAWAAERGLSMMRAPSLNDLPRFVDALEAVARRALETATHRTLGT